MKREAHKAAVRGKIISVARKLFLAQGYQKTKMRQIKEAASVEIGTIYHFYRSKEDIFEKIVLPSPTRGKHRSQSCQRFYEEVHNFLNDRSWAHAHPESTAGGVTWAELFVLFDTAGHRTIAGQHVQYGDAIYKGQKQERQRNNDPAEASGMPDKELYLPEPPMNKS